MAKEPDSIPDLPKLFQITSRAFAKWVERLFQGSGVTPARARLVAVLACSGPQTMCTLADALDVTPRNITTLVDGLEAEGLVERWSDPNDRRATMISLTKAGKNWSDRHIGPLKDAIAGAFSSLSQDERREFARLLETVRKAVQEDSP